MVFVFLSTSLVANFFADPPHLFDFNGFNEQYFLCIGCFLDLVVLFCVRFGNFHSHLTLFFALAGGVSLFLWTFIGFFLVVKGGQLQNNVAFAPFYLYWIIHALLFGIILTMSAPPTTRTEQEQSQV